MRLRIKNLLAALCVLYAGIYTHTGFAEEAHTLAVIVSSNPQLAATQQLATHDLSLIYWCKKQYWQDGIRIHPVNLHAEHILRLSFSKTVLGNLPNEQADYWNGLYFHGINPPNSLQSQEAVIRYVATTKGAIGYIDACKLDDRVKPVLWISNNTIGTGKPAFNCAP